jgi:hypothetical protein
MSGSLRPPDDATILDLPVRELPDAEYLGRGPELRSAAEFAVPHEGSPFLFRPGLLGWIAPRLVPGAATRLTGPAAETSALLSFLLASAAAAGRTVSLRDGANRFSPYTIARIGRRWEPPPGGLLTRIRLARAFTAHQMVTLAENWAEDEAGAAPPADLLVASDPTALFASEEEVEPYERAALLPHLARCLRRLLAATRRPLLLVEYTGSPGLPGGEGLPLHETIRLRPRAGAGGAWLEAREAGDRIELLPIPAHQRHLEEFADDGIAADRTGGRIDRWDVPFPPTATR